jgi:HK97 family phage portal protein
MGLAAVDQAREAIGLAMAAESTQARMHRNSLRTGGLYSVDRGLNDPEYKRLRAWIDRHLDADEQFKPLLLDRAAKFTPTAMTGVDSQHIETRRHQVEEICRHFRVMPVMVGHPADMAARAAMEQIFIAHVVHTLMPWYRRLEQDIAVGLLDARERQTHFADFDEHGLLRGALKDQAEYFSKALGSGGGRGWLTQNEVRQIVGQNPHPDGNELPEPLNAPAPGGTGATDPERTEDAS